MQGSAGFNLKTDLTPCLYGRYYGYHVLCQLLDVMEVEIPGSGICCKVFCGNPIVYAIVRHLVLLDYSELHTRNKFPECEVPADDCRMPGAILLKGRYPAFLS